MRSRSAKMTRDVFAIYAMCTVLAFGAFGQNESAENGRAPLTLIALAIVLIVALPFLLTLPHYLKSTSSGVPISMGRILGMRLRGNPPKLLIETCVILNKSGKNHTMDEVEACYIVNKHKVRDAHTLARLVPDYCEEIKKAMQE